jgi:hypothetical protein
MINRFLMGASLALLLAACGGGDGSGSPPPTSGGGGTPTPTPTPTPSQTPTPVSYTRFADLTGTQTFQAICAGTRDRGFLGGGLLPELASSFGESITITSNRAGPDYTISTDPRQSVEQSFLLAFNQSDRDPTPNTERYSRVGSTGFINRFSVSTPLGNGAPYDFSRFGEIIARNGIGDTFTLGCAYGVPTLLTDFPTTAATYRNTVIFGTLALIEIDGNGPRRDYVMSPSALTLTTNPTTGRVTFDLNLKGRLVTGGTVSTEETDFGRFVSELSADDRDGRFKGILELPSGVSTGSTAGGFFGPRGREAAFSFSMLTRDSDNRRLVVAGVAFLLVPA